MKRTEALGYFKDMMSDKRYKFLEELAKAEDLLGEIMGLETVGAGGAATLDYVNRLLEVGVRDDSVVLIVKGYEDDGTVHGFDSRGVVWAGYAIQDNAGQILEGVIKLLHGSGGKTTYFALTEYITGL